MPNTLKDQFEAVADSVRSVGSHSRSITGLGFSPDTSEPVSSSMDNTAIVWGVSDGKSRSGLNIKGSADRLVGVAFSPDGRRIAVGSNSLLPGYRKDGFKNTTEVWSLEDDRRVMKLDGHPTGITDVVFSKDGEWIAPSSLDNTIKLWEAATGKLKQTLKGHTGFIREIAFSADSQRLVSGSTDATVRIWEVSTGSELHTSARNGTGITSVAFSPDGTRVISGSLAGKVKLWDSSSCVEELSIRPHQGECGGCVFSPTVGHFVSVGLKDGVIVLYESSSGTLLGSLKSSGGLSHVTFSADGRWLAAAGRKTRTIRIFDLSPLASFLGTKEVRTPDR